jgi:hypothetical protein
MEDIFCSKTRLNIHVKEIQTRTPGLPESLDVPKFKPQIPEYMLEGMDNHNKFLLEQISIMKQQNEWQTDMVYKIYNYTKTINGKVVELEHFRQRLNMELELDEKWNERQKETAKWKRWAAIAFITLGYPIYLAIFNHIGLAKVFENLLKI